MAINYAQKGTASKGRVIVAGDLVIDYHLLDGGKLNEGPIGEDFLSASPQPGGVALVGSLLEELKKETKVGYEICKLYPDNAPSCGDLVQVFLLWKDFGEKGKPACCIKQMMGYNYIPGRQPGNIPIPKVQKGLELVVIDDANIEFRNAPNVADFIEHLESNQGNDTWYVVKCSTPFQRSAKKITNGCTKDSAKDAEHLNFWSRTRSSNSSVKPAFWELLAQSGKISKERIIVVVSASELRREEVKVSQQLSWERTAQDLYWEFAFNPHVNKLLDCGHVIVTLGASGALLLSKNANSKKKSDDASKPFNQDVFRLVSKLHEPDCTLVYDPNEIEKSWEQALNRGMMGLNTTVTGSIINELMKNPAKPDLIGGIKAGLYAFRCLYLFGFDLQKAASTTPVVRYPFERVVGEYFKNAGKEKTTFFECPVQPPESDVESNLWSILQEKYKSFNERLDLAREIVIKGPKEALKGIPAAKFEKLLTVDRSEIEAFRSIRELIYEYCNQIARTNPLNIAVFGSPGSGKSWGINQVAESLKIKKLEFNLSQFKSVGELYAAFHQVRDLSLKGNMSIVFWDEFDATFEGNPYGWLKYFLMPMQDGCFLEGGVNHPIGRAIFIFAGSLSNDIQEFEKVKDIEENKNAKIRDFISRLKGYINILGPNRISERADPFYIVRRAMVLRSQLERLAGNMLSSTEIRIDPGVLDAFLLVDEYKHGARSMESIIIMSDLSGMGTFQRSCLPPPNQLNLHVDANEFMSIVDRRSFEGCCPKDPNCLLVEDLAEIYHEYYRKQNTGRSDAQYARVPYSQLPEDIKESNRVLVRDIYQKLDAAGFLVIPKRALISSSKLSDDSIIEKLAIMEHTRWCKEKIAKGWKWGEPKDDQEKNEKKISPYLVPWEKGTISDFTPFERTRLGDGPLPDNIKEIDRDIVRNIPKVLVPIGYVIIKKEKS